MDKDEIRKARLKRQEIILKSYDALKGIADPICLDVGVMVEELKETRNFSPELSDISTGVSVIRVLNLLREKQDEILSDISRGIEIPHWKWRRLLEDENMLEDLALEIDKHYRFNSSPCGSPDYQYIPEIKELHENIDASFSDIKWDFNPEIGIVESIGPIIERKNPQLAKKIEELFSTLKPDVKYHWPKFVIADTYSESLLRLECLSFLISQGKVRIYKNKKLLSDHPDDRFHFILQLGEFPDTDYSPTSIVIGLNSLDWKYLKNYYNSKSEMSRREVPNLDNLTI